jgi:UDP-N-acetyl-2-amino-2-deoxyglucuronate dehydrogenase
MVHRGNWSASVNEWGFALVGCGRISAKHLDAIAQVPHAHLAAACDLISEKAEKVGRTYNVPWYTDYTQMLARSDVDVVNVLTESGNHARIALDVLASGRHAVVEKPLALRLQDADAMVATAHAHGVRLFTVKQNRYNPPIQLLKRALDEGRFGRLIECTVRVRWHRGQDYYDQAAWRGTWAQDGGVITNQAIHYVDLMQWLMSGVASVYSLSGRFQHCIEAEDTAVASLLFKNGALGTFEATTCANPQDLEGSVSVLGERGAVEVAGFAVNQMRTWQFADQRDYDVQAFSSSYKPDNVYGYGHVTLLADIVSSLETGKPCMVEGAEGKKALEVVTAMYESIETGMAVVLGDEYAHARLGIATGGQQ